MLTRTLKHLIRHILYSIVPPPFVPASYSQAGEDAILRFLFSEKRVKPILYLDVGTNSPVWGNNTYLFYRDGGSGVCVEPNKELVSEIKRSRPRDAVLNVGVATGDLTEADFYLFECTAISTFDKAEAEKRAASGAYRITEIVKTPLISINTILRDNFSRCPDLLSIDIEGMDLPVLKTLDWNQHPIPVVCVETCRYSESHIREKDNAIGEYMRSRGYEVFADSYINTIFVNSDWFSKLP